MASTIRVDQLRNKVRELGFSFRRQADRVDMWRRARDGARLSLPRRDLVDADAARSRQAGCPEPEIVTFLRVAGG